MASAIGKAHAQIILKTNSHMYDTNIPASFSRATVNERTTVREYLNVAFGGNRYFMKCANADGKLIEGFSMQSVK